MKKIISIFIVLTIMSCSGKNENPVPQTSNSDCGYHNGKKLYVGPEGGCYYLSSGNNKEYVNREECSCSL